ncbi:MAG: glycosyltransferase family 4 protein [Candidatus Lokiarchaeia archaeon]
MKILMVAPQYPPYGKGGGSVFYEALCQKLAERGHRITVIAGNYEKTLRIDSPEEYKGKINIIWIPLMEILKMRYPQIQGSLPPSLRFLRYLMTINYAEYDVIHLLAFGHLLIDCVNLIAKSSRKILTIHAFQKYVEKEGGASFPLKLLYQMYLKTLGRHTLNSANTITTVSRFVAEECIKKGIPPSKIRVIPNGVELKRYTPVPYGELEEKFQIGKDDILVLSIARLVWYKGFEYALEAIHKVLKATDKSIKYMIVGPIEEQNYYSTLNRQVKKLGIEQNVIFTGFISQNLKLQALTRTDVFLAPSLHEGFGLIIPEAMALGKQVIASDCEGFKCIVNHMETGILVKPAESVEIANAILMLLENPKLGERLSQNAYYEAKKYDWEAIIGRYEKLYRH